MNMRPLLIDDLERYRREADEATERLRCQVKACMDAGHGTIEIARALGVTPQAVSMRRLKLKEEGK